LQYQRSRYADPLPLSAGKFVRITLQGIFAQSDTPEHLSDALASLRFRKPPIMDREWFRYDLADSHARIERRKRVLKHHLQLPPCSTQLRATERQQILLCKSDFAGIRFDQP
jgi:hypothetical protein